MRNLLYMFVLVVGINLFPTRTNAQKIELDLLFNEWAISFSESSNEIFILRNLKSKYFEKHKDKSFPYDFRIGSDSIIYRSKIKSKGSWCGTFPSDYGPLAEEIWTLNTGNNRLRFDIYFESVKNQEQSDYSAIYTIEQLQKNYMKLKLEKELFKGSL